MPESFELDGLGEKVGIVELKNMFSCELKRLIGKDGHRWSLFVTPTSCLLRRRIYLYFLPEVACLADRKWTYMYGDCGWF